MTINKILRKITLIVVMLLLTLAVVAGAFLAVRWTIQQKENAFTNERNKIALEYEAIQEELVSKYEEIQQNLVSECEEIRQKLGDVTKEKLELEKEAKIYEVMYDIEEMKASILASRYVKIECNETRSMLGKEYFSYRDIYFLKFYFAYTDDFKVKKGKEAIEVTYSTTTLFTPYTIESRYVDQNLAAGLVMTIEEDDHLVEIVKAVSDSQASEVEDILISRLLEESEEKGVQLVVNGTHIKEWTEECKLYHETPIPEFEGYSVIQENK